ncbi:NAD(P)-binding protein [Aspergillus ruber CBS 135680]|uniref:NAD(P)-binding protein n=1 Tax=Aspergillus ruber (strain CBS 135680) TaxID=1388766 RepID=A0A017S0P6_ASPRC|nr:NAD(P)-binding protein [Aspergillus ruber CBS 135680]EYE90583.1 NAD(P)-binding protein [Aspergillus ruber CBS 135680]
MEGYIHGHEYHEAKEPQRGPSRSVTDLFSKLYFLVTGAGDWTIVIIDAILERGGDVDSVAYYPLDVTDDKTLDKMFSKFIPTLRHSVRRLVSAAGMACLGSAAMFEVAKFRQVLDTNTTWTFLVAQAAAQVIRKDNVSTFDSPCWNTSNAASHQLAHSLMPLIRVNTLSSGNMRKSPTDKTPRIPGLESAWSNENMLNRLSTPGEYRVPVVFPLGDGSNFMTSADLKVDGGHCTW